MEDKKRLQIIPNCVHSKELGKLFLHLSEWKIVRRIEIETEQK